MHIDREMVITDLPEECIKECSASGPVDDAVDFWITELDFTVDRENAVEYLSGYGAWSTKELKALSDREVAEKILWLACSDFSEWGGTESSNCGSDYFYMGD